MKRPLTLEALADEFCELLPLDNYNRALAAHVHPPQWQNPQPARRYNLLVIGGGTAGLVCAAGAAGLGAKVALIERRLMGGDCLNVGCVPSKAIVRAARAAADIRGAESFGIKESAHFAVDFAAVMQRMRRVRAEISHHDSAERFRNLGIDVFFGDARLTGSDTAALSGQTLRFAKAVIATGSRPAVPEISGLDQVDYLTNESVFSLTELPQRMAVLGGGPIGCELAQAFARLGSHVHLIESADRILASEDPDAAKLVAQAMARDGVQIRCNMQAVEVRANGAMKTLTIKNTDHQQPSTEDLEVEQILVAVGRVPNVEELGLEAAGVQFDAKTGVKVSDRLQTTNKRIYAAGDVCSRLKFTHAADAMARIVIQNALFLGRSKASSLVMPWCTYTDPEVAHVGLTLREAKEKNIDIRTIEQPLEKVDRAILDAQSEGFLKVHLRSGTDKILGATIVAAHAGEMISQITTAIMSGTGLKTLARTIYPYPTQSEALKRAADKYNRSRLTPRIQWLLSRWLAWAR